MRIRSIAMMVLVGACIWPCGATAAEIAGKWVAEVSSPSLLEPVYAHVILETTGDTVSGTWGSSAVRGSAKGSQVTLTLTDVGNGPAGELTGKLEGAEGRSEEHTSELQSPA